MIRCYYIHNEVLAGSCQVKNLLGTLTTKLYKISCTVMAHNSQYKLFYENLSSWRDGWSGCQVPGASRQD